MKTNLTYTCDSPLIKFHGNWTAELGQALDTFGQSSTVRMVSRAHGDSLTFNFTGMGIWIYPATNTPRSSFDVYLDGTLSRIDGSNSPSDVNRPLFSTMGLPCIPHVISIHNTGTSSPTSSPYFDLAYAMYEHRDKFGNATSMSVSGDHSDSRDFAWYPPEEWTKGTRSEAVGQSNINVTFEYRSTRAADAWMEYNFTGSTLSVYGSVGPSYGPYSVSLNYADGQEITDDDDPSNIPGTAGKTGLYKRSIDHTLNASFPINREGVLLYQATGLDSSRPATLVMRNLPQKQNQSLTIERADLLVYGYGHYASTPHARGLSGGEIAGLVVGPLLLIGICCLALYFLRQRRRGKLIRQQKTSLFRDMLVRRGILPDSETKAATSATTQNKDDPFVNPNTALSPLDVHGAQPLGKL